MCSKGAAVISTIRGGRREGGVTRNDGARCVLMAHDGEHIHYEGDDAPKTHSGLHTHVVKGGRKEKRVLGGRVRAQGTLVGRKILGGQAVAPCIVPPEALLHRKKQAEAAALGRPTAYQHDKVLVGDMRVGAPREVVGADKAFAMAQKRQKLLRRPALTAKDRSVFVIQDSSMPPFLVVLPSGEARYNNIMISDTNQPCGACGVGCL